MINYLIIGVCVLIILILSFLLLNWYRQLQLCKDDNLTLVGLSAEKIENEKKLKVLLKRIVTNMLKEHRPIVDNEFYFLTLNNNEEETQLDAIRFKKKDGKVFVYLNGAMTPTTEKVYIKSPFRLDTVEAEEYYRVLLSLNDVETTQKPIRDLLSLIS